MARPNFSYDVKMAVCERANWMCEECRGRRGVDFHHRASNSVANRSIYGKFIQLIANCVLLCRSCHEDGKVKKKWRISSKVLLKWRVFYENY